VSASSFRSPFETKVADIAAIVGKYPKSEWNPLQVKFAERPVASFRLGSPPLRYRAPGLADIRDGLADYIQQRRRFFDAHGLYITGLTRGAVIGRLPRLGADERREAEEYLVELRKGQENYIAFLER